ncbi:RagB/SusD family nutrient uptake outer membrane protein [Winogradskyella eckloniae]|uniref:RagB/SusD family nutrient uptake outer membrane protein n=1 Tax=Winogradskyella eckloniae TaxID=1089306 RepID=UPI0015655E3C|nr:RagB/SusD family nutrient uptake outer membrane protein [Winogradskyella eckloniae]NRD19457.1 RagB/SusD family nutrient uptake outer membrane protein [Winogradskyella eckloniae]
MKKIKINLLFMCLLLVATGCSEDFLENENLEYVSQQQLNDLANSSPEALLTLNVGVLDGTTTFLSEFSTNGGNIHDDFGQKSIDLGLDLMTNDAVQEISHWFSGYYNYVGRQQTSRITDMVWNFYYTIIRNTNSIIRQVPAETNDAALQSVLGRAKALRGFAYFNLIRIYGNGTDGVPLYNEFEDLPNRAEESLVIAQVKSDYESAYSLLSDYIRPTKDQINQDIVAGLLARFYLETGEYSNAIAMANQAKSTVTLMSTTEIADGFDDISNPEWMWGADITSLTSTVYASFFSHMGNTNPGYAGLLGVYKNVDTRVYNAISATDARQAWISGPAYGLGQYANTKFIDATFFEGDYVYMRGAEMHLILAEAMALNGNDAGAAQALYTLVSSRDAAYTLSTNTGTALMDEIKMQRKIELWGEGFAFYDMKRWNEPLERDYVGTNHPSWGRFNYGVNANEFNFQIPEDELNSNEFIAIEDQNPF